MADAVQNPPSDIALIQKSLLKRNYDIPANTEDFKIKMQDPTYSGLIHKSLVKNNIDVPIDPNAFRMQYGLTTTGAMSDADKQNIAQQQNGGKADYDYTKFQSPEEQQGAQDQASTGNPLAQYVNPNVGVTAHNTIPYDPLHKGDQQAQQQVTVSPNIQPEQAIKKPTTLREAFPQFANLPDDQFNQQINGLQQQAVEQGKDPSIYNLPTGNLIPPIEKTPQQNDQAFQQDQATGQAANNAFAGTSGQVYKAPLPEGQPDTMLDPISSGVLGLAEGIQQFGKGFTQITKNITEPDQSYLERQNEGDNHINPFIGLGNMVAGAMKGGFSVMANSTPSGIALMGGLSAVHGAVEGSGSKQAADLEQSLTGGASMLLDKLGYKSEASKIIGDLGDNAEQIILFGLVHKAGNMFERADPMVKDLTQQKADLRGIISDPNTPPKLKDKAWEKLNDATQEMTKAIGAKPLIKSLNDQQEPLVRIINAANEPGANVTQEQVDKAQQDLEALRHTIDQVQNDPTYVTAIRKQALIKLATNAELTPIEKAAMEPVKEETTPEDFQEAKQEVAKHTTPNIEAHKQQIQDIEAKKQVLKAEIDNPDVPDAVKPALQAQYDSHEAEQGKLQQSLSDAVEKHQSDLNIQSMLTDKIQAANEAKKPFEEALDKATNPDIKEIYQGKIDELDKEIKDHEKAIKDLGLPEISTEPAKTSTEPASTEPISVPEKPDNSTSAKDAQVQLPVKENLTTENLIPSNSGELKPTDENNKENVLGESPQLEGASGIPGNEDNVHGAEPAKESSPEHKKDFVALKYSDIHIGDEVFHKKHGEGKVVNYNKDGESIGVQFKDGTFTAVSPEELSAKENTFNNVPVQPELTPSQKKGLISLKYSGIDIKDMKPEDADKIIKDQTVKGNEKAIETEIPKAVKGAVKEGISLLDQKGDLLTQISEVVKIADAHKDTEYPQTSQLEAVDKIKKAGFKVEHDDLMNHQVVFDIKGDGTIKLGIDQLPETIKRIEKEWPTKENHKTTDKVGGKSSGAKVPQQWEDIALNNLETAKKGLTNAEKELAGTAKSKVIKGKTTINDSYLEVKNKVDGFKRQVKLFEEHVSGSHKGTEQEILARDAYKDIGKKQPEPFFSKKENTQANFSELTKKAKEYRDSEPNHILIKEAKKFLKEHETTISPENSSKLDKWIKDNSIRRPTTEEAKKLEIGDNIPFLTGDGEYKIAKIDAIDRKTDKYESTGRYFDDSKYRIRLPDGSFRKVDADDLKIDPIEFKKSHEEQPLNTITDESTKKDGDKENLPENEANAKADVNAKEDGRQELLKEGEAGNLIPGKNQPPLKTESEIRQDIKAKLEALRNKKNLEGQQGIQVAKSGFSIDPDELDLYKEYVASYIREGVSAAKEIIRNLRKDFGDLLSHTTDDEIRKHILGEPEKIEEPKTEAVKDSEGTDRSTKDAMNDPEKELKGGKKTMEQLHAESNDYHAKIKDWKAKAEDDAKSKNAISEVEEGAYLQEMIKTQNDLLDLNKDINKALDKGDIETANKLKKQRDSLEDHEQNLRKVESQAGTVWGRFGRLRQDIMKNDYSYAAIVERAKTFIKPDKNGNRNLPKGLEEKLRNSAQQIADLSEKLHNEEESARSKSDEAVKAKEELQKWKDKVADIEDQLGNKGKPNKTYGTKNVLVSKDTYEAAKKALRSKSFSTLIPPPELVTMAVYHLEAGSHEFVDFSKKMIKDLGVKVKPYLKDLYIDQTNNLIKKGVSIKVTPYDEILTPDQQKLASREKSNITRLTNELARLKANKPKPVRAEPLNTTAIQQLKQAIGKEKLRIDAENQKLEYQNKTKAGKVLDFIQRLGKGILLTDPITLEKIINTSAISIVTHPFEEATNLLTQKVFKALQDPNIPMPTRNGIIKRYSAILAKETLKGAWQKLVTGHSPEDLEFANKDNNYAKPGDKWIGTGGRVHGAEKYLTYKPVFEASITNQLEQMVKNNQPVTPEAISVIRGIANDDGLQAIMMNNNNFIKSVNAFRRNLYGSKQTSNVAKVEDYVYNYINAFKQVPANIAHAMARATGGWIIGITRILIHGKSMKDLPMDTKKSIIKDFAIGLPGLAFTMLGAWNTQGNGGLYQKGERKDGDLKAGQISLFGNRFSDLQSRAFTSNPYGFAYLVGGTIGRNFKDEYTKDDEGNEKKGLGILPTAKAIVGGMGQHTPYFDEQLRLDDAMNSNKKFGVWVADMLMARYEPAIMKRAAEYYDTNSEDKPSILELPKAFVSKNDNMIKRKVGDTFGEAVWDETLKGIPGLRETIPEADNNKK